MEMNRLDRMSKRLLLPTVSQCYFTRLSRNLYGPVLIPSYLKPALERVHSAAGLKVSLLFILDFNMIILRILE